MSITRRGIDKYDTAPNKMSRYYPVPAVSNLITYNSAKHIQCIPKEKKGGGDFLWNWKHPISFKMKVFGLLDVVDGLEIHSFHQRAVSQAGDVGEIGADGINKVAHSPF